MIETSLCTPTGQWKSLLDGHILGQVVPPPPPPVATMPFFGAAFDANTTMATLETAAGRNVGVHHTYHGAGAISTLVNQGSLDIDNGRVPWMNVHMPSVGTTRMAGWASAVAGNADAWWASLCKQLGALPGPILLTCDHEPESAAATGVPTAAQMSDWVHMQDRFYIETKKYANIKFGPVLMGYGQFYGTAAQVKLPALWPGAFNSGDFLALDPYNYYGAYNTQAQFLAGGTTGMITSYKDTSSGYCVQLDAFAKSKGIQWALAENGITDAGADKDITDHGTITHFSNIWNFAKTCQGRMVAYSYFNTEANSRGDWKLAHHTNPVITKQKAFINTLKLSPDWRSAW